ncbi:unnamed protein product [Symbiodinium natans]|uniref:DUF4116 domain-containing protein n=1 Tax=Symbiodinium natans TaxID=878477 RepID=A0A812KGT7_9DINO|nr:unnamed protein product [Symbiodinium natans]
MALALDSANLSCTRLLQYAELCTFEEISVSTLGGHLCTVHSQPDWFGRDLKASKMKLLYGSKLIRNVDLLKDILTPEAPEPVEILLVRQSYDLDYWLDEISNDYKRLRKAPEELKSDRHVVLAAIEQNAQAFKFAADELRGDREVAMKALALDIRLVDFIGLELWEDREIMTDVVPRCTRMYRHLSPGMKSHRELTMKVLQNQGECLLHAPAALQADREVVLLAVRNMTAGHRSNWLCTIGEALRSDKEVVIACAENGCSRIGDLAQDLCTDEDVLRALVTGNPLELAQMPAAIKEDRAFVLELLKRNGEALKFAGALCDDRECVEAAVLQSPFLIQWASVRLRGDRDLALRALDDSTRYHSARPGGLAYDVDISPLQYLSRELRSDRELVLRAVRLDGRALQFAEAGLRMDREVVSAAIDQTGMALEYVISPATSGKPGKAKKKLGCDGDLDLLQDVELLVKAVKRSSRPRLHVEFGIVGCDMSILFTFGVWGLGLVHWTENTGLNTEPAVTPPPSHT